MFSCHSPFRINHLALPPKLAHRLHIQWCRQLTWSNDWSGLARFVDNWHKRQQGERNRASLTRKEEAMSKYHAGLKVLRKQHKAAKASVEIPEAVKQSVQEFHSALCEIAPRVEGCRPERLVYVRSNGDVFFMNAEEAEKAQRGMMKAVRALNLPVFVEIAPAPNPKGGSPWYRIVGYLTKAPKGAQSTEQAQEAFSLL